MPLYLKQFRVALVKTEDEVPVVLKLEGDKDFADEVIFNALLMVDLKIRFAD